MGPHRQRLLDDFPALRAGLRSITGVHSDYLMSSTLSLGFKDIEKRTPTGVHDALSEMMVFHHPLNIQILYGNMMILFSILFGGLEMKVTSLALDLEMGVCGTLGGDASSLAALRSSCDRALLAPQRLVTLAVVAWVLDAVAFAVRQEGLQTHIETDIRMLAGAWGMLLLWLRLTDDEGIPVPISTQDKMGCLWGAFEGTMHLHLERTPQLLGDVQMLPIRGKREISLVLSQLDTMPTIGRLPAGKTAWLPKLSPGKAAFEGLVQTIRHHLDSGSRHMRPSTSTESGRQLVFQEEFVCLLVVFFGGSQHLIVEMSRLAQARHEQSRLLLIGIDSVFKRSHSRRFTANEFSCQEGMDPTAHFYKERRLHPHF